MIRIFKKLSSFAWIFLLLLTVASASDFGPRQRDGRHRSGGGISVPEPAVIALLGAGLVSLGIYAKKKRGKKQ